ncbi:MAG: phosphatidate cytidylyltransferase [Clostridium sp.]|uniref:phosphatidate cytidylyltransferase n=1 Tax=Clostridium sp. TaxID=1506 RepID=UPI0025C53E7C|nr:phosphatidate cytidylyltransferase [Clostridium sp.]MCH3963991.1 phosphatidate cytidylyltransferase [Clostridium sp.]MCI1716192.1 phosphatidate cytidylyltransferase [Clostridium sp.]MCI1800568.1 phosphatidate cytidylyltransferase [Clostridium sp.]MCI1814369.1 phosphatidate cytidylyltransferase [Clostridium sp.]MCI1871268.1 phosphatidate cytidylyltransferase [Clostridium sp.]
MNNRYLGAVVIAPFILFLFVGGIYLKYAIMILSLMGMYEFYKVSEKKEVKAINKVGYLMCIAYFISMGYEVNYRFIFLVLMISIFVLMCTVVLDLKYNFIDISITVLGFLYVAVFFSFIVLVDNVNHGEYLVWTIFISSWICDTTAYYSGRFFGKRKLCPELSPKKTVEGSIGGVAGSTISCIIFGIFAESMGVPIQIYHYIAIGILCGTFSQFGDLFASSIKRYAGAKDYSNLIPGHGGILDRFDSVLFSSFIVYYYVIFANLT